jgi:hypothetical protein
MPLFRKRASLESTGHSGDHQILQILSTQHGPLEKPRHWVHYLYVADEPAARDAEQRVKAAGWQIQRVGEAAKGPGWVVIAERDGAVLSPEAVKAARAFFEGVAASLDGGEYDGWEASG